MVNQQLLDFIKAQLLKGVDRETISKELVSSGWNEQDIQEGFNAANNPIINPIVNQTISNNFDSKVPINKKKYSLKKKIFLIIFIILCIYGFIRLKYSNYTPILETCIQSDTLAKDKINGNSIKYVECMKGYTITRFPDGGYYRVSQRTSGYVTFDKNENYISTIPLEKHSNNDFRQGTSPDFYFKDKNLFVTVNDNSDTSAIANYDSKLLSFNDDKITKVRDISFERQYVVAYGNDTVYYLNYENQTIIKEDVLTGKSSVIIDLSSIKRDSLYTNIYELCSYKNGNDFMASFSIVASVDKKTQDQIEEYYSLDLNSGKLSKIEWNGDYIVYNHCEPSNLDLYPNRVKYSKIEGKASTYNLKYDPNSKMGIYKLLLFLKTGITAGLPRVIG